MERTVWVVAAVMRQQDVVLIGFFVQRIAQVEQPASCRVMRQVEEELGV